MLTYSLTKKPGLPLYEDLYRQIRGDILSGTLRAGEKLPSKRALARHLQVGKTTVEAAYAQLLSEGLILSQEKVGFFVENVPLRPGPAVPSQPVHQEQPRILADFTASNVEHFPFSVWIKLQREVILDYDKALLLPLPSQGIRELREAIADHLASFRGMQVDPDRILVGAGTDFLYNLLIQLLGRDKRYAVEDPGYGKIRKIYAAGGVNCRCVAMEESGIRLDGLADADVVHVSPAHHFPTGIVMPMTRRRELLNWAAAGDRFVIEDDYDSEFRLRSRPLPALAALDPERVIYINSFSKTLAPSIRISYLVLPERLMTRFRENLGFYGGTVPSFEQYTLARFLSRGYFEKHINRMRRFYAARRDRLIELLAESALRNFVTVEEQDAGLHFLLRLKTELSDDALLAQLKARGILAQTLSRFYADENRAEQHCLVVNYSALPEAALEAAIPALTQILQSSKPPKP